MNQIVRLRRLECDRFMLTQNCVNMKRESPSQVLMRASYKQKAAWQRRACFTPFSGGYSQPKSCQARKSSSSEFKTLKNWHENDRSMGYASPKDMTENPLAYWLFV
jgi:hypothetical protein